MRLGCAGCLTFLLLAAAAAGAVWTGIRASGEPALTVDAGTAADGMRAQKKILDIARGRVPEGGRVVLTEGGINAFLTRHLADTAGLLVAGGGAGVGGGGARAWPMPGGCGSVTVEPGQFAIRPASLRSRTRAGGHKCSPRELASRPVI